jgi:hypothetical protein
VAIRDELRRMAFDLEVKDDWPPVAVETLWVRTAGSGRFEIDSIPFLARGVATGDLVAGEGEADSLLRFSGKLESGGHSTIQVIMTADEMGPVVRDEIVRAGCRTEVSPWPSLFSIDIPSGDLLAEVHRLLGARAAAGELEYEDACLAGA